ncbi:hypothetical protein KCP71_04535 [Salmonella enterica subsp. enterica]|nr:hypothetical protein KCP71_04535 [Salmonella enterica subsp. enterica]
MERTISRGMQRLCATYADLVGCETSTPDLELARRFAGTSAVSGQTALACALLRPSFNWRNLDDKTIASFQQQLSDMGYQIPVWPCTAGIPQHVVPA